MSGFYKTGGYRLYSRIGIVFCAVLVLLFGYFSAQSLSTLAILIAILIAITFIHYVVKNPALSITIMLICTFVLLGIGKMLSVPLPLGLLIDVLLFLPWMIIFFKGFKTADWSVKNSLLTACWTIWFAYNVLELANPEMRSAEAWVYAIRALALYPFMFFPLVFLIYNQQSDYRRFINIWFTASLLLGLYGIKQQLFGVNSFEQKWLDAGAAQQHILWGKLRVFSFLSDAAQFGASQGHAAIVATIFAFKEPNRKRRIFYLLTGVVAFIGMAISGTRGAMFVPIGGFALYLLLSKNLKIIAAGTAVAAVIGYLLLFTMFMNSNSTVARMRSAFNENDPSLKVRMLNRQILSDYMASRPFGGGVGSAGSWGFRFSPGTFLAEFQTDGMYTRIHAECGIVGLYLYLFLMSLMLGNMVYKTWHIKDPVMYQQMAALTCGCAGMILANYGNSYTGQLPSSFVFYLSMCFVYMSAKWDNGKKYPVFGNKDHLKKKRITTKEGRIITIDSINNKREL